MSQSETPGPACSALPVSQSHQQGERNEACDGGLEDERAGPALGTGADRDVTRRAGSHDDRPRLTDSEGLVLSRTCGERSLLRALADVYLAPGFSYAERDTGATGLGLALADRAPSLVRADEHYCTALWGYTCAAVPVTDPVTGELVGSVNLTTWAQQSANLLLALAQTAAGSTAALMLARGRGRTPVRCLAGRCSGSGSRIPRTRCPCPSCPWAGRPGSPTSRPRWPTTGRSLSSASPGWARPRYSPPPTTACPRTTEPSPPARRSRRMRSRGSRCGARNSATEHQRHRGPGRRGASVSGRWPGSGRSGPADRPTSGWARTRRR